MMNKIISIRAIPCGRESFNFSELFINSKGKEETLPINVLLLEHRKLGNILVNTGCSELLKKNVTVFFKYKQKHKLSFDSSDCIADRLEAEGSDPMIIKKVILTHCSPECCGALPLLPKYEIVSNAQVLCLIKTRDLDDDMMKSTMPEMKIPVRAAGIYNGQTPLKSYFKWIYDILGDGSVLGFDIRGHRKEMMGLFFPESKLLYAADAAVDERVLDQELVPSEKLLELQSYPEDYLVTLSTLRRLHRECPDICIRFLHSKDIPSFR